MSSCFAFFENTIFCNFLIHPSIESIIQKINIVLIAFIARIQIVDSLKDLLNAPLQSLHDRFTECAQNFILFSLILSEMYCYAWQTTKFQKCLIGTLSSRDFTNNVVVKTSNLVLKNNSAKLTEILIKSLRRTYTNFTMKGKIGEIEHFFQVHRLDESENGSMDQRYQDVNTLPYLSITETELDSQSTPKSNPQSMENDFNANMRSPALNETNSLLCNFDPSITELTLDDLFYWPNSFRGDM